MKLLQVALGMTRDPSDAWVSGPIKEYVVEAGVPFPFPPEADFPNGGLFLIDVPAGSALQLRNTDDGPGKPLNPGLHKRAFLAAESYVLTSAADVTIYVEAHAEVVSNV